jgi:Tol biopolymer transport system component
MTGTTNRISYNPAGGMFDLLSFIPAISGDGRYVAFVSSVLYPETKQASVVPTYRKDVFVRDTLTGTTSLVSATLDGTSPLADSVGDGIFGGNIAISGDGRYVAFASDSARLVANDNNFSTDFFVRDRLTNTTRLVSVDSDERQAQYDSDATNSLSSAGIGGVAISADGRFIAFASNASNLVPNDTNKEPDVFVRDTVNGTTEIVSTDSQGNRTQSVGDSSKPDISDDGRYVVFQSISKNLVPNDTNITFDIFVKDRQTGQTTRVSTDSAGRQGSYTSDADVGVGASNPSISGDGRYVAFRSRFNNLVPGDTNGYGDIFVKDLQTNQTRLVSTDSAGNPSNGTSYDPVISSNGRYVAFASAASNLVENDVLGAPDVFLKDLQTGTTTRVSVNSQGMQAMDGLFGTKSSRPSISADGRFIAFASNGANLANDGFERRTEQVFIRDTRADEPRPIGSPGNDTLTGTPNGAVVTGAGNDTLIAGKGKQTLTGGTGRDRFVFSKLDRQIDCITDFVPRQDKIVLTTLVDRLFSKRYKGNPIADDYVRFSRRGTGTLISLRRDRGFQGLVIVEDVTVSVLKSARNFVF